MQGHSSAVTPRTEVVSTEELRLFFIGLMEGDDDDDDDEPNDCADLEDSIEDDLFGDNDNE